MRILDIREHTVDISRFADPDLPSGGLTTNVVALTVDAGRGGPRSDRDILLFDPVHTYGIGGYRPIVELFETAGLAMIGPSRTDMWC